MGGIPQQANPPLHKPRQGVEVVRPVGHHRLRRCGSDQGRRPRIQPGEGLCRNRFLQQPSLLLAAGRQRLLMEEPPVGAGATIRPRAEIEGVHVNAATAGVDVEGTVGAEVIVGHDAAPHPIPEVVQAMLRRQTRCHPREDTIGGEQQIAAPDVAVGEEGRHLVGPLLPADQFGVAVHALRRQPLQQRRQDRGPLDQQGRLPVTVLLGRGIADRVAPQVAHLEATHRLAALEQPLQQGPIAGGGDRFDTGGHQQDAATIGAGLRCPLEQADAMPGRHQQPCEVEARAARADHGDPQGGCCHAPGGGCTPFSTRRDQAPVCTATVGLRARPPAG